MVAPSTVAQIVEDRQLFWNEYVRSIPQVPVDEAKVRLFVDTLQTVMKEPRPMQDGFLLLKKENVWVLSRYDGCSLGRIHDRLFEEFIRPALSHFAYLCQGRMDCSVEMVQFTFLESCELDPRFCDKQAFWDAYLALMKQNGLVVDDSLLPCVERIYLELFAAKHASGSIFFEKGEDTYVLWDAYNFNVGYLPSAIYEQYIQPALRGFCEISKARWTHMEAGDFFSFAPRG
jgi:hypothetical protein